MGNTESMVSLQSVLEDPQLQHTAGISLGETCGAFEAYSALSEVTSQASRSISISSHSFRKSTGRKASRQFCIELLERMMENVSSSISDDPRISDVDSEYRSNPCCNAVADGSHLRSASVASDAWTPVSPSRKSNISGQQSEITMHSPDDRAQMIINAVTDELQGPQYLASPALSNCQSEATPSEKRPGNACITTSSSIDYRFVSEPSIASPRANTKANTRPWMTTTFKFSSKPGLQRPKRLYATSTQQHFQQTLEADEGCEPIMTCTESNSDHLSDEEVAPAHTIQRGVFMASTTTTAGDGKKGFLLVSELFFSSAPHTSFQLSDKTD